MAVKAVVKALMQYVANMKPKPNDVRETEIVDVKAKVRDYMQEIANTKPRPKNASTYSGWVNEFVEYLASQTVEMGSRMIMGMGYLGEYIKGVRENREFHPDAYNKVLNPNYIISDFGWAVYTTIQENKYPRFTTAPTAPVHKNIEKDVARKALSLPYDEAVNFMGEIAGAWVLTYPPGVSMEKYVELVFPGYPKGWPSEEEDLVYILVRLLDILQYEWVSR